MPTVQLLRHQSRAFSKRTPDLVSHYLYDDDGGGGSDDDSDHNDDDEGE